MNWHSMKSEQVKAALNVKESGLSNKDIDLRTLTDGENTLEEEKVQTISAKIFAQMKNIVNLFVAAAFLLSVTAVILKDGRDFFEPLLILGVLVLNVVLGIIMNSRVSEEIKRQKSQGIVAKVMREGKTESINAENLVPGDIIFIEAGDIVPADARLIESVNLKCEESEITGSLEASEKDADAIVDENSALSERVNMVYSGCTVTYGSGTAVITEIGANTETGKIITENGEAPYYENTVSQMMKKWNMYFGIAEAVICAVIFTFGLINHLSGTELLRLTCNALIAAVPESVFAMIAFTSKCGKGIPAILTTEKLGHVTVICTEKSGTITRSKVTAEEVWTKGEPKKLSEKWSKDTRQLMEYAVLCSNSTYENLGDGKKKIIGEPIEKAILKAAANNGINLKKLLDKFPRACELPFDSERKLMTTIHKTEGRYFAVVKGAPEVIVSRCSKIDKKNMLLYSSRMAQNAMRVIAVAVRELDGDYSSMSMNAIESSLNLVGIIGMSSPTRDDTEDAVKECKNAGIKTVMVTGDHLETATAVAEQVGICKDSGQTISGVALDKLKPAQFDRSANKFTVFARVSPRDKVKIVRSLQKSGEIVAMTGKGINDVPAIKCADIGCVMGNKGASLAKGAADIVFDEGNFSAVVSAVKEGRLINSNLRRMFGFLLSCAISELFVLLIVISFSIGSLGTVSLLTLNMLICSLPVFSLWGDCAEKDIMKEQPKKYSKNIFAEPRSIMVVVRGVLIGIFSVVACIIGKGVSSGCADAMIFAVLGFSFALNILSVKGLKNMIKTEPVLNKKSFISAGISLVLTLLILLVPAISGVFGFTVLKVKYVIIAFIFAALPVLINEAVNFIIEKLKTLKVKE